MGHWGRRWRLDQRRRRHAPRWILTLSCTTRSGGALVGGGGGGSGGGGPPHLGRFGCSSIYSKNSPPSFILSGRPFFEVIAQVCNWIAVISATGNTKFCNLSINRGGPHQADPYAGERGGGLGFGPRAGGWAVSGRGARAEARRLGGARGVAQAGRGSVHLL